MNLKWPDRNGSARELTTIRKAARQLASFAIWQGPNRSIAGSGRPKTLSGGIPVFAGVGFQWLRLPGINAQTRGQTYALSWLRSNLVQGGEVRSGIAVSSEAQDALWQVIRDETALAARQESLATTLIEWPAPIEREAEGIGHLLALLGVGKGSIQSVSNKDLARLGDALASFNIVDDAGGQAYFDAVASCIAMGAYLPDESSREPVPMPATTLHPVAVEAADEVIFTAIPVPSNEEISIPLAELLTKKAAKRSVRVVSKVEARKPKKAAKAARKPTKEKGSAARPAKPSPKSTQKSSTPVRQTKERKPTIAKKTQGKNSQVESQSAPKPQTVYSRAVKFLDSIKKW